MSKNIFLYNEFRSHKLQMDVIESIEKYAPWFMEEYREGGDSLPNTLLYRGKKDKFGKIQISDPTNNERTFHSPVWQNLIIDNTKAWEGYPKRKFSLVCSTSNSFAEKYGTSYVVIPLKKDVSIGVCSADDIWFSFEEFLSTVHYVFGLEFQDLSEFEEYASDMLGVDYWNPPLSFESLRERTENNNMLMNIEDNIKVRYNEHIVKKYGNLFNFLIEHMTPNENNFELVEYDFDIEIESNTEVWVGSECLLIERDLFKKTFGR